MSRLRAAWMGTVPYARALDLQHRLHSARAEDRLREDVLLLLEHPRVITTGAKGGGDHFLTPPEELHALGFEVLKTNRGGDITYHGPGQLVGYPIVSLKDKGRDLSLYLRAIETAIIRVLEHYGVRAASDPGFTGVWIGGQKICAIGIRASRWVAMHGFALNVTTRLDDFNHIIPCGLTDRGVTSLREQLGRDIPLAEAARLTAEHLANVWNLKLAWSEDPGFPEAVLPPG
ncbi:MAG: Octanoyltransferase [Myxococcota bacterium]|nr:Octanoyltransferase [Myxococcota bacterium]